MAVEPDQPAPEVSPEPEERKRSTTLHRKQMARDLRRRRLLGEVDDEEAELMAEIAANRPKTRADCKNGPRPCLYISCKHHLYVDVNPQTGSLKLNFPDKEIWELAETCSLDVASREGITLEEVGELTNLTRERIRQVEARAIAKVKSAVGLAELEHPEKACAHCKGLFRYDPTKHPPAYCGKDCARAARDRLVLLRGGGSNG